MYKSFFISLLLSLSGLVVNAQVVVKERTAFTIGESIRFKSQILKEERLLNIYLPTNYDKEVNKKYPVIYLLDGSVDEDFIHIAGLVQFGSFSWIEMLPASIVVGIANVDRRRDFTYPTDISEAKKAMPTAGGSAAFIDFLEEEVQTLIAKQYSVNDTSTLIGQSLGGLLAAEILYKKPAMFDNYIIVSPSLWWDDESLLNWDLPKFSSPKSIYVAVGKEGAIMERVAKALYEKLDAAAFMNTQVFYQFLAAQDHGDALHLAVYDAFEKIFSKQ